MVDKFCITVPADPSDVNAEVTAILNGIAAATCNDYSNKIKQLYATQMRPRLSRYLPQAVLSLVRQVLRRATSGVSLA